MVGECCIFPDGPVVRTPHFHRKGHRFGELRSHMLPGEAKKKRKIFMC